ncbi:MAG: glutamate-ammonia-ligase adenylyltransferase [Deltaproteobacteria bacterium]|nr:glutamate-ammonia-ligase adenylyltransferase [Deltaproteobacteria bacterium]
MKPNIDIVIKELPDIDEKIIKEHLDRLGEDYYEKFSSADVLSHIRLVSRINRSNPVQTSIVKTGDSNIECTVIAFDYPSEFSLITGLLSGTGFNIVSGDVYTYERKEKGLKKRRAPTERFSIQPGQPDRRMIVDFFSGYLTWSVSFEEWSRDFNQKLLSIISMLENGAEDSVMTAKNRVNEMVVRHLARMDRGAEPVLYPVELTVDNDSGPFTHLKVVSQDTPAFMYALSNALALNDIQIEHVRMRTFHGRVEDSLELTDARGGKIEERDAIERIRFSVLLTKQFTYFLARAPDPYTALSRFEFIIKDIVKQPFREEWFRHLTDGRNLKDLARLLGASDFLWEDFIRLQYESLLTVFDSAEKKTMISRSMENLPERLDKALQDAVDFKSARKILNRFKDQEIFLIDLDHILNPDLDFRFLSRKLTVLAELVINRAADIVYADLAEQHGKPKTESGLDVKYAIMGLGKLGGKALGYASDLEIILIYSDRGRSHGEKPVTNAEFFELMVKGIFHFIEAKREGIFQVDLRLRPHGNSGPLACSMESYCQYYGFGGQAHSYEILSLVRMRCIGGDSEFGARIERIRDEVLYFSNRVDFKEIRDIREKQLREKTVTGRLNAKYSPGGLVDLEYGVQTLQVMYGKNSKDIRTYSINAALNALRDNGFMSCEVYDRLSGAYRFLRILINGLRMLRGSALDLFLPATETPEFEHLARRMGYRYGDAITPAQQLYIDLETHMAAVRVFAEKYFGLDSLTRHDTGTIADLILSDTMPPEISGRILSEGGIKDTARAYVNLQGLAGRSRSSREVFGRLAILAWDIIKRTPDPDMTLNNWERFICSLASPESHYSMLLSRPMHLEMLLTIFSNSQFLSDTLIRYPGFFDWLMNPKLLNSPRKREDLENELKMAAEACCEERDWLNKLRRFRRREILRIGTRDIYMGVSTRVIMHELSILAEACTQVVLEQVIKCRLEDNDCMGSSPLDYFSVIAFGKLGGDELNYSSDIDLIGVFKPDGEATNRRREIAGKILEGIRSSLSSHTEEGYAYRVDLRLRPFGSSGEIVQSIPSIIEYYRGSAALWEKQAALKMRPVAGNIQLGHEFLEGLKPFIMAPWKSRAVVSEIERMRKKAIKNSSCLLHSGMDVKSGMGGIRDVEFMVQGLQLIYGHKKGLMAEGNTLLAIESLEEAGIFDEKTAFAIKDDYIFLRRIEHYLQILEDRQTHTIPVEKGEINTLAKKMLGTDADGEVLLQRLDECIKRVRSAYEKHLLGQA